MIDNVLWSGHLHVRCHMSVPLVLRTISLSLSLSLSLALTGLSGDVWAAGEPLVFPPELRRDIRDAPIPVRVCPEPTAVQCASESYKLADDQLNVVYNASRERLKSLGQLREEQNLVRAQRAWIQFRDAHCTHSGEKMAPGTGLNSFFAIACMEVETIRRTYYLGPHSR